MNDMSVGNEFKVCVVIPIYNHEQYIAEVVQGVMQHELPCYIVDDGSAEACKLVLESIKLKYQDQNLKLLHLDSNQGKGAALKLAFNQAGADGYSHALQLDADMQHSLNDIPVFVETSQQNPLALISGMPVYDNNVPRSRKYGRKITNFWCMIETLSLKIKDALCGYRIYPLEQTLQVMASNQVGSRMDFDPEVMVRLYWLGLDVKFIPTKIIYHAVSSSHFNILTDNILISLMHTRLCLNMLLRAPNLIKRHF